MPRVSALTHLDIWRCVSDCVRVITHSGTGLDNKQTRDVELAKIRHVHAEAMCFQSVWVLVCVWRGKILQVTP